MRSPVALLLPMLFACRSTVRIDYMYPAEFTVPPDYKVVAVVDRVVDGSSGLATAGLRDALAQSPTLKVANPAAVNQSLAAVKVPNGQPLDRGSAEQICKGSGASGIVTLDGYRFGGDWSYEATTDVTTETVTEKPADCKDCPGVSKEVTHETPATIARYGALTSTNWSVISCVGQPLSGKEVATGGGLEGRGEKQADAREDAGDPKDLEAQMARGNGAAFSVHISPRQVSTEREYFKGGSKDIRAGSKAAKADHWKQAENAWERALKDDSAKVRGKAQLNLAVAAEHEGDIAEALKHARKANRLLEGKKGSAEYLDVLSERAALDRKVQDQLGGK